MEGVPLQREKVLGSQGDEAVGRKFPGSFLPSALTFHRRVADSLVMSYM
jgi:hypothetical protein